MLNVSIISAFLGLKNHHLEKLKFHLFKFKRTNYLEPCIIKHISSRSNFTCCVDVGSNYGQFLNSISQIIERDCTKIVIDPNPDCIEFIRSNIANTSDRLYCVALSSNIGKVNFYTPRLRYFRFTSLSTLDKKFIFEWLKSNIPKVFHKFFMIDQQMVILNTLDNILDMSRDLEKQNVLLKLDVQGLELEVLKGGLKFLKKFRPLILLETEFSTSKEVEKFLMEIGYFKTISGKNDCIWEHVSESLLGNNYI